MGASSTRIRTLRIGYQRTKLNGRGSVSHSLGVPSSAPSLIRGQGSNIRYSSNSWVPSILRLWVLSWQALLLMRSEFSTSVAGMARGMTVLNGLLGPSSPSAFSAGSRMLLGTFPSVRRWPWILFRWKSKYVVPFEVWAPI